MVAVRFLAGAVQDPGPMVERPRGLPGGRDLRRVLASADPEVCEVVLYREQTFEPKLTSRRLPDGRMISSPLEDMAPFLPREELRANMLVPLVEEG